MRRDSKDIKWKEVKKKVVDRDIHCRLLKVISVKDFLILKKHIHNASILDPAHIISVGKDSTIMYEDWNIVLLNRYSHEMLDSYKSPIDGHNISANEVKKWWKKILMGNPIQYQQFIKNMPNYFEE